MSTRPLPAASLVVGALLLLMTRTVHAEGVSARLVWDRSASGQPCIDKAALEAEVNRRWRREVFVEGAGADLVVEGKIGRAPGGWSASIEMRRADGTSLGTRELVTRGPRCSALNEPVALALGIMLDVSRKRVEEERATASAAPVHDSDVVGGPSISIPEPPPAEAAASEPLSEPSPAPGAVPAGPAPARRWHFEPFAAVEGFAGVLPGIDVGGRFGVSVIPPERFRVELSASVYGADEPSAARPGVRLTAWAAELAGYPLAFVRSRYRADIGAAVRLVEVQATGVGLDQDGTAEEGMISLGPRARLSLRVIGPLLVVVGLGGDVVTSRYRFVYRTAAGAPQSVYETSLFSAQGFAGLGLWL